MEYLRSRGDRLFSVLARFCYRLRTRSMLRSYLSVIGCVFSLRSGPTQVVKE
jgi:hypothetical protein